MSPIGTALLTHCENDMSIWFETAQTLLPEVSIQRIKTVCYVLGIKLKGNPKGN